ncbi:DUF4365 domain-containing protein [Enhygromyxa salina]|uniref:DUF4365 domain-containing protein n=1 Tax=Enhygromyxa salina TaxID=215803 RepID=A0A2S9YQP3_9BACT|nr:DUF4365 domain-containing protein [Enhygromyxa salina]PRQ07379.1 hypothetical protein ENSA7_30920 [Enhygromyxa salina]
MANLPETQLQENFSLAYVRAVAAAAGFSVQSLDDDYDSVDLLVMATGNVKWNGQVAAGRSPSVALQVKCSCVAAPKDGALKFPISIKNYNDLRDPGRITPAVLVVLYVPRQWSSRLKWSEKSLILRRVAYWKNLRGEPPTSNADNVTVTMTEFFSPESLTQLMYRVAHGELT